MKLAKIKPVLIIACVLLSGAGCGKDSDQAYQQRVKDWSVKIEQRLERLEGSTNSASGRFQKYESGQILNVFDTATADIYILHPKTRQWVKLANPRTAASEIDFTVDPEHAATNSP